MNNGSSESIYNVTETSPSIEKNDTSIETKFSQIFIAILVITAMIAMIVNVIVFTSVYWIRRPMPPILKMSISLAAADALSSSIFALTLFFNTYLPLIVGLNVGWLQVILEMIRLSGILITVTHLLALSLNHYIGILKPLHYNSIVTRRKVTAATIFMWIVPTIFIIILFVSQADDAYWKENFLNVEVPEYENRTTFTDTFRFRMSYSAFFFISIILMAICYIHILIIVRRQQNVWKTLSRSGSTKWTNRVIKNCNTTTKANREQRQLEGNIRAIYTTLLILGSCVIGWMPALLIFVLMCKEDCYIHGEELKSLIDNYLIEVMSMRCVENMLIVLKMLANPIIYSIRMKEIQEGTKHMQLALSRMCCTSNHESRNYILAPQQAYSSGSLRTRITSVHNNRSSNHVVIGRTELVNTLL